MQYLKIAAAVTSLVVTAGVLAGCSTQSVADQVRSEQATASPAPEATSEKPQFDANAAMKEFVNATFAQDYPTAALLVSPGSVAERYITHLSATRDAYRNAGMEWMLDEGDTPSITFEDNAVTVDYAATGNQYAWSGFEFDDRGLVTSWTTASGPMDGNLASTPFEAAVGGNTVTLLSAYQSSGGALWVTLKVAVGGAETDVWANSATSVDGAGAVRSTAQAASPTTLPPNSTGLISVVFDQADLGGTVHLEGYDSVNYTDWSVQVPIS